MYNIRKVFGIVIAVYALMTPLAKTYASEIFG